MQAMEHPNCPANLSKFPKQKDNEKECRKAPTSPCVNGSLFDYLETESCGNCKKELEFLHTTYDQVPLPKVKYSKQLVQFDI